MNPDFKPMLCASASEVPTTGEWALEAKYDGWRAIFHVRLAGEVFCWGRSGNIYSGKAVAVEDALRRLPLVDVVLDGELVHPDGWGGVQSEMTSAQVRDSNLTFMAFDVLRFSGQDCRQAPWELRREVLAKLLAYTPEDSALRISPFTMATQDAHDRLIAAGAEGSVCKRLASSYVNGRSPSWVKIKPQETLDVTITGFKPGKGEREGMVGAVEFEMDNGQRSRCSGMSDRTLVQMSELPGLFIGKRMEIKHHGITKHGKPRHPQFVKVRDDL